MSKALILFFSHPLYPPPSSPLSPSLPRLPPLPSLPPFLASLLSPLSLPSLPPSSPLSPSLPRLPSSLSPSLSSLLGKRRLYPQSFIQAVIGQRDTYPHDFYGDQRSSGEDGQRKEVYRISKIPYRMLLHDCSLCLHRLDLIHKTPSLHHEGLETFEERSGQHGVCQEARRGEW